MIAIVIVGILLTLAVIYLVYLHSGTRENFYIRELPGLPLQEYTDGFTIRELPGLPLQRTTENFSFSMLPPGYFDQWYYPRYPKVTSCREKNEVMPSYYPPRDQTNVYSSFSIVMPDTVGPAPPSCASTTAGTYRAHQTSTSS